MNLFWLLAAAVNWIVLGVACWLGWHLLRQNGRTLLRLDELEKRLDELESWEFSGNADDRVTRFSNRSLAHSRIKRDGLKSGTLAPDFRLPRLDGRGELSLEELRGKRVLLIFSDPHCGPCQTLAPHLEKFHGAHTNISVVMIGRGEPKENRAKVKEHDLTFPVVLQRQWEISRHYAMFATPIAYLIDEQGVITNGVAVGVEPVLTLMTNAKQPAQHETAQTLALEKITPISSFSVAQ